MFSHPFGIAWRKALVSIPRLVPDFVLHFTNPEGPQPVVFDLPSRDAHMIPVYVFIPPAYNPHNRRLQSQGTHLKEALRPSPNPNPETDEKLPVLIDFHGGGFVLGSPQEQAPFCAQMCRELNCVVISVDYRLGPYAQYPAAIYDAEDVVRAVTKPSTQAYKTLRQGIRQHLEKEGRPPFGLDETRIALSGFSSGGNLVLNLALSVKDDPTIQQDWPSPLPWEFENDIPLLLFYPSFDARLLPHERPRPDGLAAPTGIIERWQIEKELMPTYLPVECRDHPRASPGLADIRPKHAGDHVGLHPKAKMWLLLPQYDSLHGQSLEWIEKVKNEGRSADLTVEHVKGVVHGWTQFPDAWISEEHRRLEAEAFREARSFVDMYWNPEVKEMATGESQSQSINQNESQSQSRTQSQSQSQT
ncbi:hypothetical protein A1O3_06004 [Capronia epimyces CBS 606.96]|uniref:Alpha/beta hydrolase fold-3 domain-containing protein n=1 Tax=Capronia epimyces CBS 606.96 TaxID=1182542 RepID=W9XYY3_9EURO|nr:uncharacterized protein A1O3_06004 [Capronia epimyces CBS 606.96]EXJ82191.1 hypothetical protein A1O3_06004 [Capronia epimyces CBS 606.96]